MHRRPHGRPDGGRSGTLAQSATGATPSANGDLKSRDDFLAMAAHELRTPLTVIRGYVEMLLEERAVGGLEVKRRHELEIVARHAHTLEHLIDELALIGRGEAGRLVDRTAPADLSAIAHACAESARPAAEERGVALAVVAEPLPACPLERARIAQVVDNLIANALKYTPPGGRVEVRTAAGAGEVLLSVADSGIGIPAHEQARVFERFYRAPSAVGRGIPGSGLGLSISTMIVEAHGGRITLESAEGRGSTFTVALPTALAPAGPARPTGGVSGHASPRVDTTGRSAGEPTSRPAGPRQAPASAVAATDARSGIAASRTRAATG